MYGAYLLPRVKAQESGGCREWNGACIGMHHSSAVPAKALQHVVHQVGCHARSICVQRHQTPGVLVAHCLAHLHIIHLFSYRGISGTLAMPPNPGLAEQSQMQISILGDSSAVSGRDACPTTPEGQACSAELQLRCYSVFYAQDVDQVAAEMIFTVR